jgi:hypothetical protein
MPILCFINYKANMDYVKEDVFMEDISERLKKLITKNFNL